MSTILGIGELLWDEHGTTRTPGGAPFNFAFHCQQIGHPAAIVSRIGQDTPGQELMEQVRISGVQYRFIQIDPELPTGAAIAHGDPPGAEGYTILADVAWDHLSWDDSWSQAFRTVKAVCFGTLAQRHPTSRRTIYRLLRELPRETLIVCDLNLREPLWSHDIIDATLVASHWLKLNHDELVTLRRWYQFPSGDDSAIIRLIRERFNLDLVCVTYGAAGSRVQTAGKEILQPGIPAQKGGDSIGAGDAFTAALLGRTLEGKTLEQSIQFAACYSSKVAGLRGGTPRFDASECDQ